MALQEARDLATPELHSMFGLRRRRPRAAAVTEFSAALKKLGFPQNRVAKLFGVSCRHIRRWQHGNRTVPRAVRLVINLLVAGAISIDQVEAAADPVPAQTNGVKPALPARLRAEPTTEQSAPTCAKTAARADPGSAAAKQILALTANGCRWAFGNPQCSDFHFCGREVVEPPYCEEHRLVAYLRRPLLDARPAVTRSVS